MTIRTGVIGLGYWGPNYIRNFIRNEQTNVVWGCDLSEKVLKKIKKLYPQVKLTRNYNDLLNDHSLNLIAIATPPETHYKIAKEALEANKHVLVAKPIATEFKEAKDLVKIARDKKLLLHCDLTYLYTDAIITIKDLLEKKVIGKPIYYDSIRTNLGLIQNDVNVIWDLAPHDFSIILSLFKFKPIKIFAIGSKHHKSSINEEIAHITINFTNNFIAHIHISWLSPVKLRTILIGGDKKMIHYNDLEPDEKIKIYDKSIHFSSKSITPFKPVYRSGNIIIPRLENEEALFQEIKDIIGQISKSKITYENAKLNMNILTLLKACDESLKEGKQVIIKL